MCDLAPRDRMDEASIDRAIQEFQRALDHLFPINNPASVKAEDGGTPGSPLPTAIPGVSAVVEEGQ